MTHYLYWQFVRGPLWLATLAVNLQRALLQFFSVPVMLRTLIAHWHRDAVPYTGGSISSYALAFSWNIISRGIGFLVRSALLVLWLAAALVTLAVSGIATALFIIWPFASAGAMAAGIMLL